MHGRGMQRITFGGVVALLGVFCLLILIYGGDDCSECYSPSMMVTRVMICGIILVVGSVYFRKKFLENEKIIFNIDSLPVIETNEATEGVPFSGYGKVDADESALLTAPYSKEKCVYYHSVKQEYIKKGKNSSWKMVENIASAIPFYIEDERGRLYINLVNMDRDFSSFEIPLRNKNVPDPQRSEIDTKKIWSRTYSVSKSKSFFSKKRKYREQEYIVCPNTRIFVFGDVSKKDNRLEVHESKEHPLLITQKTKEKFVAEFYKGKNVIYLVHFLMALGFTVFVLGLVYFTLISLPSGIFVILIGNVVNLLSLFVVLYNRMVTLNKRAQNAQSNIAVELKRRADLIPQLVNVVKGYTSHEARIQKLVALERSRIQHVESRPRKTEDEVFSSLAAIVENYPDLKVSESFTALMNDIVDTEERIAYSREFYNTSVAKYNTIISQFPFLLLSYPLGMKPMQFISIEASSQK